MTGDPDALVKVSGRKDSALEGWAENEHMQLLNLTYDSSLKFCLKLVIAMQTISKVCHVFLQFMYWQSYLSYMIVVSFMQVALMQSFVLFCKCDLVSIEVLICFGLQIRCDPCRLRLDDHHRAWHGENTFNFCIYGRLHL